MTDDARRHWHGNPGNRHEHHNVWVQGGPKGPSARAAWALTPEMIANSRRVRIALLPLIYSRPSPENHYYN